jgi:ATP-binding cassette subfamily C protein
MRGVVKAKTTNSVPSNGLAAVEQSPRDSLIRTGRASIALLARQRSRLVRLVALGIVASAMEAVGAVLLLVVLRAVSQPNDPLQFPLLGNLYADFPGSSRSSVLVGVCLAVAAFFLVRCLVLLVQTRAQYRAGFQTAADLSHSLVSSYLLNDYALSLTRNSGELARTAWDAVNIVAMFALVPVLILSSEVIIAVALVVVVFAVAPALTVMALVVLGVALGLTFRYIHPRLRAIGRRHESLSTKVFRLMQQSLGGARDVRLFHSEQYFIDELDRERHEIAVGLAGQATMANAPRVIVETVFAVFLLLFVAVAALNDQLDPGTVALLGLFAYAALRMMPSLNRISLAVGNLRSAGAAVETVTTDLAAADGAAAADEGSDADPRIPRGFRQIVVDKVSYHYPNHERLVLDHVSVAIDRGTSLGVVGSTGAGKSTLIDLVLGLLSPTSGTISVDGIDVFANRIAWQRRLGVVSQSVFLLDDTLRRNVAFGLPDGDIDDQRVAEAIDAAHLGDFVESLPEGLETVVGERGARLSGGQRQRVAIARALYRRPEVIVFDEGTSALDNLTESAIMSALEALHGDRTLIIVAHRLTTVRRCDQIVLLENGRVIDTGTYDDLVERSASFRRMAL